MVNKKTPHFLQHDGLYFFLIPYYFMGRLVKNQASATHEWKPWALTYVEIHQPRLRNTIFYNWCSSPSLVLTLSSLSRLRMVFDQRSLSQIDQQVNSFIKK
jgi:hypothetical protein